MTCESAETLLHQSLDRPLAQPERAALDLHWEVCLACRRERDAQRRLALLAGRWAEQALALSDPGSAFTVQVLDRLEVPARRSPFALGLTLAAAALLLTAMALLPGLAGTSAMTFASSLYSLPHWLAVSLAALPNDALALPSDILALPRHILALLSDALVLGQMPQAAFGLPWTSVLLPLAIGLNVAFCLHARQSGLQRSVS